MCYECDMKINRNGAVLSSFSPQRYQLPSRIKRSRDNLYSLLRTPTRCAAPNLHFRSRFNQRQVVRVAIRSRKGDYNKRK